MTRPTARNIGEPFRVRRGKVHICDGVATGPFSANVYSFCGRSYGRGRVIQTAEGPKCPKCWEAA